MWLLFRPPPKLNNKDFLFTPPKGSKKIEMVPSNPAAGNN